MKFTLAALAVLSVSTMVYGQTLEGRKRQLTTYKCKTDAFTKVCATNLKIQFQTYDTTYLDGIPAVITFHGDCQSSNKYFQTTPGCDVERCSPVACKDADSGP